jgi:asparagine N-glycosylation enzyme membrane subunit Stt3
MGYPALRFVIVFAYAMAVLAAIFIGILWMLPARADVGMGIRLAISFGVFVSILPMIATAELLRVLMHIEENTRAIWRHAADAASREAERRVA